MQLTISYEVPDVLAPFASVCTVLSLSIVFLRAEFPSTPEVMPDCVPKV